MLSERNVFSEMFDVLLLLRSNDDNVHPVCPPTILYYI